MMSLQDWVNDHSILPHKTSPDEIEGLLKIVDREIIDAGHVFSADGCFFHAYQACFILCKMVLHASGYKAARNNNHANTIMVMPEILGDSRKKDAKFLDTCRGKRNKTEYDLSEGITQADADALLDFATEFREDVVKWFKQNHPDLLNI